MTRSSAVLSRFVATRTVRQYGSVVLSLAAAAGLSLLLRGYVYPRLLFLLALVLSIWGRGLGPGLVAAGLATVIVRFLFPELLPAYGLVSDTAVFGLATVAVSVFSRSKLRAEARRKLAEDQLRTSERRLTLAQSAAHLGQWDWDLRTNTHAVFGEYLQLYGLPADQAPPTHEEWLRLIHPDDRERVQSILRESIERTHVWDTEFRVRWPDGSIHWLLGKGTVFLDDSGQPVRIAGVNLDITQRKRTEDTLRVSQQRFDLAQEASGTGTWDWDATTNEAHCSIGHCPLYGLPPSDRAPSFEEWLELIYPEDRARMREELDRILESADHFSTEFRVVWPDATIHWLYGKGRVFRDSRGNPLRMIGVNMDISDRKRAEAALRESEERFRNMADTAPVMIWVCGPDKLVTFFNQGWLNFTGRTMEQQLGTGWTASVHPEELDRCYETYSSSFDARRIYQMEHRLRRADGEYRWVLFSGVPRFETGGVFAGYIGSCIDITDQKRTEATLRQSLDEMAHLNRVAALGELTASMAHELNQPLAAILCNAQAASRFLGGESPDLAQVRECLTEIVADDKRAGEVIKRLRGLLKKGEFQPSSVDLNEVVSDAIQLVMHDALLRDTSVVFEPFPDLPSVLGDRIQLYQVVLNLIVNGLEATAERPPVDRRVSVQTAASEDGGVQLTVEDSGKGIADGDMDRVFEPFFSTKPDGLGMGLSISRSIVQAHGGRIWAENSAGGGAVFSCVWPVAEQTTAASAK